MTSDVLVIGGGIAGIQASLDLADKGLKVHLVEKKPSIGGRMAQLDKTFPTNDCSICILAPKMADFHDHENINVMTYSEVKEVRGKAGDFQVRVLKKARYVDVDKCTGCGECAPKCPKKLPNEFDMGLGIRKAIYIPFLQAVPKKMTIDKENCIMLIKGKCGNCKKVCRAGAINFEDKDLILELNVGAIIVAIGFDVYDPTNITEYGYGKYDNVYTAMEYERLICAAGPTQGHLKRRSDEKRPKNIAFIQCVGSRDLSRNQPYCSRVCCMHTTKEAILAKEHYPDIKSLVFYMDLRALGKGFQEYVDRAKEEYDVEYIRAKPGNIEEDPGTKNLRIWYDDTIERKLKCIEVEMVILATTLVPTKSGKELAGVLGTEIDEYGFFKNADLLFAPMDTNVEGIYIAGYCQAPMDIPEAVAQASGAAARAAETISIKG
ncbi:MAG: CoB--CoM heterodisulfide reductase iron-sulfur subunit A family protein [Thermoplasmata archaeon]